MIARSHAWLPPLLALVAIGLPVAGRGQGPTPTEPGRASIGWESNSAGRVTVVSLGLPAATLATLREAAWPPERLGSVLVVAVESSAKGELPAMLGTYAVDGSGIRFTPRFPLDRGVRYRATFRPEDLPGGAGALAGYSTVHVNPKAERPATTLARVDPPGAVLPENLLKFYLHFSSPMARGEAYEHIRIRDEAGKPLVRPFLELGEELWDPTGTRLTVLLDPGRIKRGLPPREELGPILERGRAYTLEVDATWPDAEGAPLAGPFRKGFRAGPEDQGQPDPKTWTVAAPKGGTRDPLALTFPEPLDRALLESGLALVDARGDAVAGRASVLDDQAGWRFTPDAPWAPGEYRVEVDPDLEDLAGNSVRRPFEVDVQRDTPARAPKPDEGVVRLPIRISSRPGDRQEGEGRPGGG